MAGDSTHQFPYSIDPWCHDFHQFGAHFFATNQAQSLDDLWLSLSLALIGEAGGEGFRPITAITAIAQTF